MDLPGKHKAVPYLLVVILSISLLASACSFSPGVSPGGEALPVEPVVPGLENAGGTLLLKGRFSIINPETEIYALSLSRHGRDILFSSDARSVNMLDNEGHLRWEVFLEGQPISAALASDGSCAAVGTDCGCLYLLSDDGRILWEIDLDGSVQQVVLSSDGASLAVLLQEAEERYKLCVFEQWGALRWEKEVLPLQDLQFLPGDRLAYLEEVEQGGRLVLLEDEETIWQEEARCAAFSDDGGFAALYQDDHLKFYQLPGNSPRLLWDSSIAAEITSLVVTEKGEKLLAYSNFSGTGNNLFAFKKGGVPLWEKKIPAGALLQTSRYGEKIVASSWQEYSEDFSKLLILDEQGQSIQELEMASRIVKMVLSRAGNILTLAGNDGNIFILDVAAPGASLKNLEHGNAERQENLYNPVVFHRTAKENYLHLYFYDENALHLIPVSRKIKNSSGFLQTAVNELVKGPTRSSGLSRTLPKDTAISVTLEDGLATLDLPAELNRLGGTKRVTGIIDSLLLTVSQFSAVENIRFLIEGETASSFSAEGLSIEKPFPPRTLEDKKVFYLPYCSGERYYLLPRESVSLSGKSDGYRDLLGILLTENKCCLPVTPVLNSITRENEWIVIDWGPSFKNIFPWQGTPEEKARAALFSDSLLLTLGSNFHCKGIVHLVEGRFWEPPPGYPSLRQEYKRLFYLNPE